MERNGSYGASWADQWDYNQDPAPVVTKKSAGSGARSGSGAEKAKQYGKKVGEVASTGMKKVKVGTSMGFHWIKDKYHKTTNKH